MHGVAQDHMIRDINAGRYSKNTSLVLVTHGLAARIFLMRWFHWTVDQFMEVFNPPNAEVIAYPLPNWGFYTLQAHMRFWFMLTTRAYCQVQSPSCIVQ